MLRPFSCPNSFGFSRFDAFTKALIPNTDALTDSLARNIHMAQNSSSTMVLITGANQGIGFELSRKLAKENDGWHILMGSRNPENGVKAAAELKGEGLSVEPLTVDITSDQSIEHAAKEVESKYGRLDILINNAGISIEYRRPDSSMREIFQEQYNTNVFGHHIVTETFEPLLAKSALPRIIFVSSIMGSIQTKAEAKAWFASEQLPVYRSTKAALNMIMAHWSYKHKDDGWKINSVCPGYVATNLNKWHGMGTVESGTTELARIATMGKDGPTGTFSDKQGPVPW